MAYVDTTYPSVEPSGSCALGQMRVGAYEKADAIDKLMAKLADDQQKQWQGGPYNGGQTALICVTHSNNINLNDALASSGWNMVLEFPRRNGYDPGTLWLWVRRVIQ